MQYSYGPTIYEANIHAAEQVLLFNVLLLSVLSGIGSRGIYRTLVNGDADALGDLDYKVFFLNIGDGAVDTTGSNNLVALAEAFAELTDFFLSLLLGTNHEEPHNNKEKGNHDEAAHAALFAGSLKTDEEGVHRYTVWYLRVYIFIRGGSSEWFGEATLGSQTIDYREKDAVDKCA